MSSSKDCIDFVGIRFFKFIFIVSCIFSLLGSVPALSAEQKTYTPREELEYYTNILKNTPEGSEKDMRIRKKVIELYHKLDPPPAIPKEARRHAMRAEALLEIAKSEREYKKAFGEYKKALIIAPWWADAYFNYALVQEAAEYYEEAIRSYKLFVLAAPNDPAAKEVENKMFKLEVKAEEFAAVKPWLGKWYRWKRADGKKYIRHTEDIKQSKYDGKTLTMSYLMQYGNIPAGEAEWYGTINGLKLKGKLIERIPQSDTRFFNCFGPKDEIDMTAEVSQDGKTITVRYRDYHNLGYSSCTKENFYDAGFTYKRIEE